MAVSLAFVQPVGSLVETVMKVHVIMLANAHKMFTHTPVVLTQNVSITKVHMTANVLMTTNVLTITTIVTKVDLAVLMKLRHVQWNGSVVLLHTQ